MNKIIGQLQGAWPQIAKILDGLPDKVIQTISAPGKDPRLTAIVVVSALVLFLLVSTVLEFILSFFIRDDKDSDQAEISEFDEILSEESEPGETQAVEGNKHLLGFSGWLIIAFCILLSGTGGAIYATSQSKICTSCHEMESAGATWKTSTHKNVNCLDCHRKAGIFGFAAAKISFVRMVTANYSGTAATPINATLEEGACDRCHKEIYTKTVVVNSIRVSHKEIIAAGYACADCHASIGHGKKTSEPGRRRMNTCLTCHGTKVAKADCTVCHVKDAGLAISRIPSDFPKPTLSTARCKGCHNITKCTACHGVEMPHSVEWMTKGKHAKYAAFEKKQVCKKCHGDLFCSSCHKFPGHSPSWKGEHQLADRSTEKLCMSCHTADRSPVFCALCHDDSEPLKAKW